jgi:dTDP-4-dehydrorhamnose 3,5-epimerase
VVLSDTATLAYKVDNYYAQDHDKGIAFDDEQLAIDWRLPKDDLQLSDKDKNHPNLSDTNYYFE